MARRLVLYFLLALALAAGFALAAWGEARRLLSPASPGSIQKVVAVKPGATPQAVGRMLEAEGLIRSARAFRWYMAATGQAASLKAGEYALNPSWGTPEIVRVLVRGRTLMHRLTLPEGLTMAQVARRAAERGLAEEAEFLRLGRDRKFIGALGLELDSLEGYLFPETYFFGAHADAATLIRAMTGRFLAVWDSLAQEARASGLTRHQIVTLASIVEKETGAPKERPLIAAVFLNRLKKGMRLQSDPTVIYGLEDFDGNLTRRHLQTLTPYNTYRVKGLPPSPIANPGRESMEAVIHPAAVDYLYFVAKGDDTHHFSATLSEHNRAVTRYQLRR